MGGANRQRSYAILGTGALGGLYGGLLAKAGLDVHFLVRSDFAQVRDSGLRVDSPLGDFHLQRVQCYQHIGDLPQVDVAIVAWKTTTANEVLASALGQTCGPDSAVLVLQNGWDIERQAADCVGAERVLGGGCFLCCNKAGPGHIQHLDYGRIEFGEYDQRLAGITPRMEEIAADFHLAGIDMQPAEDLRSVRWRKLAWNIPFNGLTVALDADTSQIMNDPSSAALAEQLMLEVREAARACGSVLDEAHLQKMLHDTRQMVPYDSSMRQDFRHKRPIEVEAIFGNPLRAAQQAGYLPRKIEMLYEQLCFLDRANRQVS